MIPRPARLIAALLLLGAAAAHSQALKQGSASWRESSDSLDDPFHEIHLLRQSVVDGRMVGSETRTEELNQSSEEIVEIPERITGGRFQETLDMERRAAMNLLFEGLTQSLWVRNGVGNECLKSFAAANREAARERALETEVGTGCELLVWPSEGIVLAGGNPFPGDDSWNVEIQQVPEPSAMIFITLSCGMLLTRRRV